MPNDMNTFNIIYNTRFQNLAFSLGPLSFSTPEFNTKKPLLFSPEIRQFNTKKSSVQHIRQFNTENLSVQHNRIDPKGVLN